jgi:hypothetical protein
MIANEDGYIVEEIFPRILVFKGALDCSDELIKFYEQNFEWSSWFTFGTHITEGGPAFEWDRFPERDEWHLEMVESQADEYKKRIAEIFYDISKIYTKKYKYVRDSWICRTWNIAKYNPTPPEKESAMQFHTDFQQERAEMPGDQFGLTCVFYPNDDYEGGEIQFTIVGDSESETKVVSFKPEKGDVILFPATEPYYHGVGSVRTGTKYIIRLYWLHNYGGSPDWHLLKEKYGPDWEILEEHRLSSNYKTHYFKSVPGAPKLTLAEYYERLDNGTLDEWDEGDY